ncbi:hypothetical protein DFQ01_11729 [Paenibacillus cellulosilyticus]|uniref:Uncharacterized protein n=1 Tax=Paenibacillus cellulosilyticus TaxID=375489 RepID=A0A2V2YPV1_9BACL|nr:hypothetical protein [Paenibacillus cellulosilyticus]PWV98519.1 hypothetical protein DFQ01_11729 [Paenibacillus cellulosilyticus]QKS44127.1 hypothetical protein HUB94_06555 [Paenibacillus cellulosilyticus]
MTEQELIERLARMGPTETQVERMLNQIMNPSEAKPKRRWSWGYRIALPAVLGLLLLVIGLPFIMNGAEEPVWVPLKPVASPAPMSISIEPRGLDLTHASDVRKFLNYNGSRYEFLNNGEPYDLSEWKLGENKPLGKLDDDITADVQAGGTNGYASQDFGTTYLVGGILYKLPGYDPAFRLVVEQDGRYYIVQLVGRADDSSMTANEYVESADLDKLADRVELLDHSSKLLHTWSTPKDVQEWIKHIASFEPAGKLTNEQDEQLAKADSSGETYTLRAALKDGTTIDMKLTPEMHLIAIGDSQYKLSDEWLATYSYLFDH